VWYATGFSTAPLAGAGAVAALVFAAWLTRRRKGR
jgi:LPXTG-motif cell wall-anchored protein